MRIIGLTGPKGSGKTTVFNIIKELNPDSIEIMLAHHLKEVCANTFNLGFNYFEEPGLKEKNLNIPIYLSKQRIETILSSFEMEIDYESNVRPHIGQVFETPRRSLQYVGTEILRKIDPDTHCKFALRRVKGMNPGLAIVTDLRFINEKTFFENNYDNFHTIYIKNTTAEKLATFDSHSSEKDFPLLKKGAKVLYNEGSLLELRTAVISLLEEFSK